MDRNQELFLLVVKEQSFTKAAALAYMSQQAVSEHIRNLEEQYGVKLFIRKPRLKLTEEGEILHQALLQIHNKEEDVKFRFEQLSKGVTGNIELGINSSRSSYLIPNFFPAYNKLFPHVSLSIYSDDTVRMIERLRHGDLDIVIGVNAAYYPMLDYIHLIDDSVFYVASQYFLKTRTCASEDDIYRWTNDVVPPDVIEAAPVAMNTTLSTIAKMISAFMDEVHVSPEIALRTSNYNTQLKLCCSHQVGMFLPTGMIPFVIEYNAACNEKDKKLLVMKLPAEQSKLKLRIDCILQGGSLTPKNVKNEDRLSSLPAFKASFIKMLRQTCKTYKRFVEGYLSEERNISGHSA